GVELRGRVHGEDHTTPNATVRLVPKLGAERFTRAQPADADGSFVMTSIAPFGYRLEVRAEGYVELKKDINLDSKKPMTDLRTLSLARAWELNGVVLYRPDGMGVPGARVNFVPVSDKDAPKRSVLTDDFGVFVCSDLKAGNYKLTIEAVGFVQKGDVLVD